MHSRKWVYTGQKKTTTHYCLTFRRQVLVDDVLSSPQAEQRCQPFQLKKNQGQFFTPRKLATHTQYNTPELNSLTFNQKWDQFINWSFDMPLTIGSDNFSEEWIRSFDMALTVGSNIFLCLAWQNVWNWALQDYAVYKLTSSALACPISFSCLVAAGWRERRMGASYTRWKEPWEPENHTHMSKHSKVTVSTR